VDILNMNLRPYLYQNIFYARLSLKNYNPLNPLAAGKNPQADLAHGILKPKQKDFNPSVNPLQHAHWGPGWNDSPEAIILDEVTQTRYRVEKSIHFLETNHLASSLTHRGEINKEEVAKVSEATGEPYLIDRLSTRTDNAPILGPSPNDNRNPTAPVIAPDVLREAMQATSIGSQTATTTTPPATQTTPPVGKTAKSL
jgi:hypothetical protein